MTTLRKKYLPIALAFAASAILLSSCEERAPEIDPAADEALMTEYSEDLTIIESQNGKRSYRFTTPLVEGYSQAREPYREFRKGIRMVTYQDDSLSSVDVVLTANYAIYYEKRKLWEAKGNVVVEKFDGKKLFTQQLFWNATTKKVYSNVDTRIVQGDRVDAVGAGFETDEEFKDWRFRYSKGRTEIDVAPRDPSDSTRQVRSAAADEEPKPASAEIRRSDTDRTHRPAGGIDARPGTGSNHDSDKPEMRRRQLPAGSVRRIASPVAFEEKKSDEPAAKTAPNQPASEK